MAQLEALQGVRVMTCVVACLMFLFLVLYSFPSTRSFTGYVSVERVFPSCSKTIFQCLCDNIMKFSANTDNIEENDRWKVGCWGEPGASWAGLSSVLSHRPRILGKPSSKLNPILFRLH